jgi:16S rRNA A1518/A1519 N6-dimethyltransferase RsmA/KsgA/DIM1 with predicted DNA glycosylase/AP lyase activity
VSPPDTRGGLPRPRKRFGQHFLEPAWVAKIVASLHAAPTDRFIEIGPGRGALTRPLAPLVAELVAVEMRLKAQEAPPGTPKVLPRHTRGW